jgi:membrane protein
MAAGSAPLGAVAAAVGFFRDLYRKLARDDVLLLASGVAFNILLAGVPFFLLLAAGLGYALGTSEDASGTAAAQFIAGLFPASLGGGSVLDPVIRDIVRTRGAAGAFGAVSFIWFSTRLFGSLRGVFNTVFEVTRGRGIIHGKLFDMWLTVAAATLVVLWIGASAYIAIARTRGVTLLAELGLHSEAVMRPLTYITGRLVTFALVVAVLFALYKLLPYRPVRREQALLGATVGALLFEAARFAFTWVITRWNPASLYTGALAAIVIVVFWVYYAALVVLVGGGVSQVWEHRVMGEGPRVRG